MTRSFSMGQINQELEDSKSNRPKIPILETFDFDSLDSDTFKFKTENILNHFPIVKGREGFRQLLNIKPSDEAVYFYIKFIKKRCRPFLCLFGRSVYWPIAVEVDNKLYVPSGPVFKFVPESLKMGKEIQYMTSGFGDYKGNISRGSIGDAFDTFGRGPGKRFFAAAMGVLVTITSHAARYPAVLEMILDALDNPETEVEFPQTVTALIPLWGKISEFVHCGGLYGGMSFKNGEYWTLTALRKEVHLIGRKKDRAELKGDSKEGVKSEMLQIEELIDKEAAIRALTIDVIPMLIAAGSYIFCVLLCKVVEVSTAKTGKHGHAKCHFVAIDIFNGKKLDDIVPSSHNCDVPNVSRTDYQLLDITDDGFVSLLTENGNTKDDLKLSTDDNLWKQINEGYEQGKDLLVTVLSAMGEEQIIAVKDIGAK